MNDRVLMQMANRIEALAFEMKAPNDYTPQFVMLANEMRKLARLAQPDQDDGYCQACEGKHCTAKDGCVALDNPRAQPEQEPVAWWHDMGDVVDLNVSGRGIPLYFAPPQREWQGLTDEDLSVCDEDGVILARYWEAKLKEKNT